METESRRKGPRSPSVDSDDSSHRRRSRKYDRSPSPRRSRYRRSRSRDRRSGSRERRRKESSRSQDWKQVAQPSQPAAPPASTTSTTYAPAVHNQYQAPLPPNTSQPPPPIPAYNPGYNNYNYNYGQGYDYGYQQPPPAGYRSDYPPPNWSSGQVPYNNQQAPPAPTMPPHPGRNVEAAPTGLSVPTSRPEDAKKEAIAAEAKQQKATLAKQREEYVRKSTILQRELETLRQQCDEIGKEGGRENNRIIKENQKLQIEIQNKMKTIHNVIDMLTGIIGDKVTIDDLRTKFKSESTMKRTKSPKEEFPKGKSESPGKSSDSEKEARIERERKSIEDAKPMYNFVHYDPEMHWCKICDIFPKTAKEYLNHLHTNEHKNACLERKIVDMPWHERNGEEAEKHVPEYPGLPTKRTPIKGLQFFSAATSWYCKLCNSWIGDLHCASLHLKSKKHSENFARFVEQNPHWETDWMADRERAFSEERRKQMQLELHKQKDEEVLPTKSKKSKKWKKNKKKSKKRKNRSSASETSSETENTESDSDHDMSKSIRVAMRNKMKASTQAILNEEIDYHGIKLKGSWAQVAQVKTPATPEMPPPENDDRQLLNSIRDKLKAKQEEEMKNSNNRKQSMEKLVLSPPPMPKEETKTNSSKKLAEGLEAWGPKEPPKPFWIKKDEEKPQPPPVAAPTSKSIDVPKPEEIPKPHMGFWTKQQVNMPVKPSESKATVSPEKEEEPRERGSDRGDRYKEERDRKYDRREDKYERSDRYERRRGGSGRDRERERDRDRDSDYYEDRRKSRYSNDSPRREKNWRDSPKRSYDKYSKDSRREENNSSNDESKFEKKTNESATKLKKGSSSQSKKSAPAPAKGKLPFIGRLPLFKKKNEEPKIEKADIAPLPYQQSKFEDTPKVPSEIINPPGVVHITKLATPVNLNNSIPVKVVPAPIKILVAPPPPTLHNDLKNSTQPALPTQQVVDMEIEDQSEETIIEEPVIAQQEQQLHKIPEPSPPVELPALPPHPPPALSRPPPSFPPAVIPQPPPPQILPQIPPQIPPQPVFTPNRPPPFIATAPPPFVPAAAAKFSVRPPPTQTHPSYVTAHDGAALAAAAASYAQAHGNPPPPMTPIVDSTTTDVADIPEPAEKRPDPSMPLPDDLQEALNIIFPKEETAEMKTATSQASNLPDTNVMYASMYSILGCVGYGPEYMDVPPPEITQADTDTEAQPGPDDLRMLGIDEGDTIF